MADEISAEEANKGGVIAQAHFDVLRTALKPSEALLVAIVTLKLVLKATDATMQEIMPALLGEDEEKV